MNKRQTTMVLAFAALSGMAVGQITPARAQLRDVLTGGAVLVAVDRFGGQIDTALNRLLGRSGAGGDQATKVVPILSVGRGAYAGAVQVTGPQRLVNQVRAVAQVEGSARLPGIRTQTRLRGLVPISSRSVTRLESLQRVNGVGVSALVDVRL